MHLFAIADPHFDHEKIIGYCDRPFTNVYQMNDTLKRNWNRVVGPEDRVIVCGDFQLGPKWRIRELLSELNGVKGLIMGNHDRRGKSFYMEHFSFVADRLEFGRFIFTHHPIKGKIQNGKVNIYGHTHQRHQRCGQEVKQIIKRWNSDSLCVSVEAVDYTPVAVWKGTSNV